MNDECCIYIENGTRKKASFAVFSLVHKSFCTHRAIFSTKESRRSLYDGLAKCPGRFTGRMEVLVALALNDDGEDV